MVALPESSQVEIVDFRRKTAVILHHRIESGRRRTMTRNMNFPNTSTSVATLSVSADNLLNVRPILVVDLVVLSLVSLVLLSILISVIIT